MKRYLTSGQMCQLLGIPFPTLDSWVRMGTIKPMVPAEGTGNQRRFSQTQCLAISLSRWMKHEKGYSQQTAGNVLEALLTYSDDELQRQFDEGRTFLLLVGQNCMPWLVLEEAKTKNPEIQRLTKQAHEDGINVDVELVDVKLAWQNLDEQIEKLLKRKPKEKPKAKAKQPKKRRRAKVKA